jgi:ribosomal protein S18 acetylase RimI-like enzyme
MNRPSMTDHYHIRTLQLGEIDTAVDWAAAEGWNPGVYDARCFHAADPHGFLGGFIGDELIATISAVKYGHTFGFIGFYIVKADYRSHGYGLKLWNAALASLGNRLIGLDGVFAQQENYRKSGFALAIPTYATKVFHKPIANLITLLFICQRYLLQRLPNMTGSTFQSSGRHF